MRKSIFIMTMAVFAISLSVLAGKKKKKKDRTVDADKNVVKTDSTTVIDFDGYNTVNIEFNKASDDVVVKIYKNEELVYTDSNMVSSGTTISYDITDNPMERDFDIVVEMDGRTDATESIRIH